MDDTSRLSAAPVPQKPRGLRRTIQLPGTTYFRERRMRPLFFGWLCGLITMLAMGCGVLVFALLNYATRDDYGNFSVLYYGAAILSVVVILLLLILTTTGLPIVYGYSAGIKRIFKIMLHELVFLAFILAFILILGLRYSHLLRHSDPSLYYPHDCLDCGVPL